MRLAAPFRSDEDGFGGERTGAQLATGSFGRAVGDAKIPAWGNWAA